MTDEKFGVKNAGTGTASNKNISTLAAELLKYA
jgi:hypothetical protein